MDSNLTPILTTVLMLLVASIVVYIFLIRRAVAKKRDALALNNAPLPAYSVTSKVEGWYPLPDGLQDRYFDGKEWTETYRPHIELENRVSDREDEGNESSELSE